MEQAGIYAAELIATRKKLVDKIINGKYFPLEWKPDS